MARKSIPGVPRRGNLSLRCQAPADYLRSTEVVCGRFVVGGSRSVGEGAAEAKSPCASLAEPGAVQERSY
jgi:hypothetical protein